MALSSAEAEYYGMIKAVAEALGVQAVAADMGETLGIRVYSDSSAARAIASRTGQGKVRHMDVRHLWLQELVRRGRRSVHKVKGTENPADGMTKPKNAPI